MFGCRVTMSRKVFCRRFGQVICLFVESWHKMRKRDLVCGMLCLAAIVAAATWLSVAHRRHSAQVAQKSSRILSERIRAQILSKSGKELSGEDFKNSKMRGVILRRLGNAFQRADFSSAELDQSIVEAGASSFQLACFDNSSIKDAQLSGGGSSFQIASFNSADLSGTSLEGNFQLASFQNAVLRDSTLHGSFQGCDISGADFSGADLTGINRNSLESCYFSVPPAFSSETIFPLGFSPGIQGWQRLPPPQ